MDNVAIEGNPYVNENTNVISDGTFKVAKMSNKAETPKIQTLSARWQKELAKVKPIVDNVTSHEHGLDLILNRLGAESIDYYNEMQNVGVRKLKVNRIVRDKSKKVYGLHDAIVLEKNEPKEEKIEVKPVVSEINNINLEEVYENPAPDTRMSRLERTGEMPVNSFDNQEMKRQTPQINDVINTPTRFERHMETPFDALINDNNVNSSNEKRDNEQPRVSETRGGDPNLYNKLIHGGEKSDISIRLQDAKNKLYTANEEREKAKAVNASLEQDVEKVRKEIEKIKRDKKEKEERELSNTLNMLQATKEEILGETRKYDNLQEELAELIRQRDNLLGGSSYDNEGYSKSRAI